ncbi:hypothetical protein WA026_013333 [Henosepilachna vigintioctopunctata]|uniref:Uncharacterized protein n=1 Tax=Henosepilachna vigintioctopunctata TaxID=420089 RepID=A0AAW1V5M8_9CUCU
MAKKEKYTCDCTREGDLDIEIECYHQEDQNALEMQGSEITTMLRRRLPELKSSRRTKFH